MKSAEEIMEILEAYDLTGSFRDAAELAGCSHHTVAAHVAARDAGRVSGVVVARPQLIDEHLDKIEEWVEHSAGKIRADKAHRKLLAQLFDEVTDPILLMKLKEVVEKLEDAADAFEKVANTVETIALKES